jgi:hypothetical protein
MFFLQIFNQLYSIFKFLFYYSHAIISSAIPKIRILPNKKCFNIINGSGGQYPLNPYILICAGKSTGCNSPFTKNIGSIKKLIVSFSGYSKSINGNTFGKFSSLPIEPGVPDMNIVYGPSSFG